MKLTAAAAVSCTYDRALIFRARAELQSRDSCVRAFLFSGTQRAACACFETREKQMASELARLKAAAQNARKRGDEVEGLIVRKAVITGTGALQGFAETKGLEIEYLGVPTKLGIGLIFGVFEAVIRDKTVRRICGAVSDAELGAYSYAAAKAQSFIAGSGGRF